MLTYQDWEKVKDTGERLEFISKAIREHRASDDYKIACSADNYDKQQNEFILDFTDKYTITEDDFPDEFHRVAFGAIYKIHELGADRISLENIADFLSSRPKSAATFKQNKGEEWLLKVAETCLPEAFDYYYNEDFIDKWQYSPDCSIKTVVSLF